ncbi:MAG: FtsX-like permease family protein, partial [Actinobacteria bacterium]
VVDTALDMPNDTQPTARVVGIPLSRPAEVNLVTLQAGRMPEPGTRGEAVLNLKFAGETGVGVGDTLTLRTGGQKTAIKVVGIGSTPEYFYPLRAAGEIPTPGDFAVFFMDQELVGGMFGRVGAANDVAVLLEPGADVDDAIDEVERILDPYFVIDSVKRADQPSNFGLTSELEQNRIMADFLPPLVLLISSLSLFIALSRLVQSQRGEIGLMKALGYTDAQVLGHYLMFSVLIALMGSMLGIALGQWAAGGEVQLYVDMLGVPFMSVHVYPKVMLNAVLMSTAACVAAGFVPAWAAVRIPPAKAMHSDPNLAVKGGGRIPLVERLFGWAMPRSFTFRIPLRNLFRARRRTLYTIVGIAFSMVLTVATWSMFDAFDFLIDRVFTQTERWDVLAAFEDRFGTERVNEVEAWKGVRGVEPALLVPAEMRANGETSDGMITAMTPSAGFHGFDVTAGGDAADALRAGRLVMAESVARKLGVGVGDTVRVETPYTDKVASYEVGALSDESLGGPVFASADVGRELMGTGKYTYNVIYLYVDPQRADEIRRDLYDLPGATQVQVKADFVETMNYYLEFTYTFGGIMLAFGFAMAAAVIYNTFTANIHERTREIATMRTIGEDNGRLAAMVTIENVFLALAAVPLGVWLGVEASKAMFSSFSTEAYSFKVVIYPTSVAWITGANLVVLLLSEIPPVRRIFRLDLAEATKVME